MAHEADMACVEANRARAHTVRLLEEVERVSMRVNGWLAEREKERVLREEIGQSPFEKKLVLALVRLREETAMLTKARHPEEAKFAKKEIRYMLQCVPLEKFLVRKNEEREENASVGRPPGL